MKKIGILDLCSNVVFNPHEGIVNFLERKQQVSLTSQVIAVWCRQLGHQVHYATYYGFGDPIRKLPDDLDIVFISSYSFLAPLAYALAKVYRRNGTRTVIGGAHAKSFPQDARRYFDLVVLDCNKELIADIIADHFEPQSIISSPKPYNDIPTIEERLPEIKASVFWRGKSFAYSLIPMLASIGCPYTCNFCIDWNSRYHTLPTERLLEDLRYASKNLPGVKLLFDDPNFGIRFDETLDIFESIPPGQRNPYFIETSLSNLRSTDRLKRLRDTNCLAVAPGIESWNQYSNKAGVGTATHRQKLDHVVEHLQGIHEYIPHLQANFILGLDTDAGDEPFEMTKEFIRRTPFVFPTLNTPMPFGGTPLYSDMLKQGRILKTVPFSFYRNPYLALTLKNYDPLSFFQKMVDLYSVSDKMLATRLTAKSTWVVNGVNSYRTFATRSVLKTLQETLRHLQTDANYRAFHAGQTERLPDGYVRAYQRELGKYAELMPVEESQPLLDDDRPMIDGEGVVHLTATPELNVKASFHPALQIKDSAGSQTPL